MVIEIQARSITNTNYQLPITNYQLQSFSDTNVIFKTKYYRQKLSNLVKCRESDI
ncbi:MAG: hypothetical protein HC894_23755 [Microcoleus sp. SM1_3_4]|nr:hypothetical protein [Microcoleus sp. SM1_3_4]